MNYDHDSFYDKAMRYVVHFCIIVMIIFLSLIVFKALSVNAQVLTEEEIKKRDAQAIQKQKDAQKAAQQNLPQEQTITIEDVKVEAPKEIIIRRYKPSTTFYDSTGIKAGQPISSIDTSLAPKPSTTNNTPSLPPTPQAIKYAGFCMPADNYEINVYAIPATLNCVINNKMHTLKGRFVPTINAYHLSFTPTEFTMCKDFNNNFSIVRRTDYSPNLATSIDKKIIENVLLKTTASTGSDTASALITLMRSQPTTQIITTPTTTTITQQTQTTKDVMEKVPYLAGAHLLENASRELLSHYGGRIPPVFTVSTSEIYQVEGQCNM